MRAAACRFERHHTPSPEGYMAWHSWAERMSQTHRQHVCPGCGLWEIWRPKDRYTRPKVYEEARRAEGRKR